MTTPSAELRAFWRSQSLRPGLVAVGQDEPLLQAVLIRDYLAKQEWLSTASVVEVGCGIGRVLRALGPHRTRQYVGLDWCQGMLLRAKKCSRGVEPTPAFVQADISLCLPLRDRCADVVIAWTVLCHVLDDAGFRHALEECMRISRKRILICDPVAVDGSTLDCSYPTKRRPASHYAELLRADFECDFSVSRFGSSTHPEAERILCVASRRLD